MLFKAVWKCPQKITFAPLNLATMKITNVDMIRGFDGNTKMVSLSISSSKRDDCQKIRLRNEYILDFITYDELEILREPRDESIALTNLKLSLYVVNSLSKKHFLYKGNAGWIKIIIP